MDDLIAFWKARLDEDEAAARRAASVVGPRWETGPFIALHDPARALREVEADRAILDLYLGTAAVKDAARDAPGELRARDYLDAERELAVLGPVVRCRAAVYRGHPGYRPGWAPEG